MECKVEKTKIEEFAEQHDCVVEIRIDKSSSRIMIYKNTDLYIYSNEERTLNEALTKATKNFLTKRS